MIIQSILDTDSYKFTMQQFVLQHFPDRVVRYELIMRTPRKFSSDFYNMLLQEIREMSVLKLSSEERLFLSECGLFKRSYLEYLQSYRFDPYEVMMTHTDDNLTLCIEGHWYRTILWEVPLMSLISELYFINNPQERRNPSNISEKASLFERLDVKFTDFGTRRRYSLEEQNCVVNECIMKAPHSFQGTSNPMLAQRYHCPMKGTQAHELYMAIAAMYGYNNANVIGMDKWIETYKGNLGIALTDTFTTDVFLRDFDAKYSKIFDGVRQDSGDPIQFVNKMYLHYMHKGINPMHKTIIFSDNLNPESVQRIHKFCQGQINDSYGIGTNLTNDVGVTPLNMVIKLTALKRVDGWVPTVKLSDNPEKHTGDAHEIKMCKLILNRRYDETDH